MSTIIKPTIGRVVWLFVTADQTQPFAALVVYVHSDRVVNVAGFEHDGGSVRYNSCPLVQDGDALPPAGPYACWMPYQKGQAAKTNAAEAHAKALDVAIAAAITRTNLTFGEAIDALKQGRCIARAGWNGKSMFVYLNEGSFDRGQYSKPGEPQPGHIEGISANLFHFGDTGTVTRLPNINMRAASGSTVTGWLASQTDMLAEDWQVITPAGTAG